MQTGEANDSKAKISCLQTNIRTNTTEDGVVDVRRECWPRVEGAQVVPHENT